MTETEKIVSLNRENIQEEHICCAIADKKCAAGYGAKKDLMAAAFGQGYRFNKLNVRGKVFLDYAPQESSWYPIEAENYLVLGCFWVSGKYKGKGWARELLQGCINEAKSLGKAGLVSLVGKTKKPFLSDKKMLEHFDFKKCDEAAPYFELVYLPLQEETQPPHFLPNVKQPLVNPEGLEFFYSSWCPFTLYYLEEMREYALEKGIPFSAVYFQSREEARRGPSPFPVWSVYYKGVFLTHEILTKSRLEKLLA